MRRNVMAFTVNFEEFKSCMQELAFFIQFHEWRIIDIEELLPEHTTVLC